MQFKYLASAIILASLAACGGGSSGGSGNTENNSFNTFELMSSPVTDLSFTTGEYGKGLTISRKNHQITENTWKKTDGYEHLEGTDWVLYQSGETHRYMTKDGTFYTVSSNDIIKAEKSPTDNSVLKSVKSVPNSAKTKYTIINSKDLFNVKIIDFLLSEELITDGLLDTEEKINWLKGFGDKTFLEGTKVYTLQEEFIEKKYVITNYPSRLKNQTLSDLINGKVYSIGGFILSLGENNTIKTYGTDDSGKTSSTPKFTGTYTVVKPNNNVTIYEFPSEYSDEANALISDGSDIFSAEFKKVNTKIPFPVVNDKAMRDIYELLSNGDSDHKLPKPLSSFNN